MQLGMSSYSFASAISAGVMDILGVIDWIADSEAQHLEIAAAGLGADLAADPELVESIRKHADERGVELTNYAVAADFHGPEAATQMDRLKAQIDIAERLGIPRLRHDVVQWGFRERDQAELEEVFATVVPACQEIADYAAEHGVATSVENHGFCLNNSERIQRLIHLVDRPNFGTTLDIGNALCVDESPVLAVTRSIGSASVVHLKDFCIRRTEPGRDWLRTLAGNYLRGAVLGFGDLEIARILRIIKDSGFDGPFAIEFEGAEDPLTAAAIAMENATRMWHELG